MLGLGALGQYPLGGGPVGAATTTSIGWFVPLSEPVRFKRDPRVAIVLNYQVTAFNPLPIVPFAWFDALSEPVRQKPRSPAALSPFAFFQPAPSPFVPTGWFEALSEPVRFKPGLKPGLQQFLAYQANPTTVTPFAWFAGLSEPVRKKPGLLPALQKFFTTDTSVIPLQELMEWFQALSEPVRFKQGLAARLQQFLAAPSQLRPTPTTTAVLNALETKDTFLAGVSVWNRVETAEIGTSEFKTPSAEIGAGVTTVAGARISVYTIN